MTIIYKPKGRAREYAPLAVNLYNTCSHGCLYCYASATMKMKKDMFHAQNRIKKNALEDLAKDARKFRGDDREILLSFMGDCYNPDESTNGIPREAVKILIENNLRFTVLTKGGDRVRRDLDLFQGYSKASIGGPVNYQKTDVDWRLFHDQVVDLLEKVGAKYILKDALLEKRKQTNVE